MFRQCVERLENLGQPLDGPLGDRQKRILFGREVDVKSRTGNSCSLRDPFDPGGRIAEFLKSQASPFEDLLASPIRLGPGRSRRRTFARLHRHE